MRLSCNFFASKFINVDYKIHNTKSTKVAGSDDFNRSRRLPAYKHVPILQVLPVLEQYWYQYTCTGIFTYDHKSFHQELI